MRLIPPATTILNFHVHIYITKFMTIIVAYICNGCAYGSVQAAVNERLHWSEKNEWVCEETIRVGLEKHNVAVSGDSLGKTVITRNLNVG